MSKSSRKYVNTELPADTKIKSYGVPLVMMSISKQIGLLEVLQNNFPHKWESLLATAFYMVSQDNVMMYLADWFEENNVKFADSMTDGDCSKLFESIVDVERDVFFTEWTRFHGEQQHIVYDVTSFSTYSKDIDIAEWGYNRDNDNLTQLNFGMFYAGFHFL